MSNEEKKRLEEYNKKRNKLIIIQTSILCFLSVVFVILILVFYDMNKSYYVSFTENSSIDYTVTFLRPQQKCYQHFK